MACANCEKGRCDLEVTVASSRSVASVDNFRLPSTFQCNACSGDFSPKVQHIFGNSFELMHSSPLMLQMIISNPGKLYGKLKVNSRIRT